MLLVTVVHRFAKPCTTSAFIALIVGCAQATPSTRVLAVDGVVPAGVTAASASASVASDGSCYAGAYSLADGSVIDIQRTAKARTFRWHRLDGRTGTLVAGPDGLWRGNRGWTAEIDPTVVRMDQCHVAAIEVDGRPAHRVALHVVDTRFASGKQQLRGRLVMPPGDARAPIVILVHGSEKYSGVDFYHEQHLFPAHGVGVFVYDKRGTGQSSGRYTQDFNALANDAVAALAEARRLAGSRTARIGFRGSSQGGWVAPLAATRATVDFVQIAYGLAESPAAEDREQVMSDLRMAGYGPDVLAKAREVTDATALFMATRGRQGGAAIRAARRYSREPWWKAMRGEYTGSVLRYPTWITRLALPFVDVGTPWNHDPVPVLRSVQAPQLWMIAADDREAPPAETQRRLQALAAEGRPITTVIFPDTDHGIVEFVEPRVGQRIRTRFAEGFLAMSVDWIRDGRLGDRAYGRASVADHRDP
ncbi:alpha/beta hydrolase family protein [Gemmatimonas sp.]|uniref:alpha/beta hydrolase family protein n=1 Tax=Gemmatimonas sp. TaxID=1962908 RepID=UPI00398355E5